MKRLFVLALGAVFFSSFFYVPESFAAKTRGSVTSQTRAATSKKLTKKYKKKFKRYVAPPKEDLSVEAIPLSLKISDDVASAVAKNDIDEAIRLIRTEPPSSRALTFLKSMEMIRDFNKDNEAPKVERNLFYRNLGISYHNLFLFLKRKKMENIDLYKNALKYYKRSLSTLSQREKIESNILMAEITAQNGEIDKAKKLFSKIDTEPVGDNAAALENIAAYYAAIGDKEKAYQFLKEAYAIDPEKISIWLTIGDDFLSIEKEPEFKSLQKK